MSAIRYNGKNVKTPKNEILCTETAMGMVQKNKKGMGRQEWVQRMWRAGMQPLLRCKI